MNSIDINISILAVTMFLFGLKAGFLRTLLAVLSVYASAIISLGSSTFLGGSSISVLGGGTLDQSGTAVLFIIIFVVLNIFAEVLLTLMKSLISVTLLGSLDMWFGAALGVVRALLIGAVICDMMIYMPISISTRDAINKSFMRTSGEAILKITYPLALSAAPNVSKFLSDNVVPVIVSIKPPSFEAIGSIIKTNNEKQNNEPAIMLNRGAKEIVSVEAGNAAKFLKRFTP